MRRAAPYAYSSNQLFKQDHGMVAKQRTYKQKAPPKRLVAQAGLPLICCLSVLLLCCWRLQENLRGARKGDADEPEASSASEADEEGDDALSGVQR